MTMSTLDRRTLLRLLAAAGSGFAAGSIATAAHASGRITPTFNGAAQGPRGGGGSSGGGRNGGNGGNGTGRNGGSGAPRPQPGGPVWKPPGI
ncbi:MAG: hypothetical protein AB7P02_28680 [Alphaproteobacteria bacterium]